MKQTKEHPIFKDLRKREQKLKEDMAKIVEEETEKQTKEQGEKWE